MVCHPDPYSAAMIGKQIAHYVIREQLGRGGMGVVYRATDTRLDRDIGLKFLPPEMAANEDAKARFVQEAKAASALDHPNICTIHEIGETDDGKLFIAMSYYQGQTLKNLLEEGAFSESKAASVAMQIADGLRTAHNAGIIHRDIKPANIILTEEGRVKILDFGLAKLGQGADLTKAGSTVGTTAYMSPEQSSGEVVDGRTDLWSLGAIFYEMLSGKKAFGGEYDQAVLYSVLNQNPEPLTGVDEGLVEIVNGLLKKDPAERTESAADLMKALDPYASGITRIAGDSGSFNKGRSSKPSWAMPAGIGLALIILFVGWWLFGSGSESSQADVAGLDDDLIVVLPFSVQGPEDMAYLSESMVTILSTLFDGAGTVKTVDHASVLESIQQFEDGVIGPSIGQELSRQFGAGHFILGSIIKVGASNRITARLYTSEGKPGQEAVVAYPDEEGFIAAIDELASGLMRGMLDNPDQDLSSLAAGTTDSFEALRLYLNAEKMIRAGQYQEGLDEINRALSHDSTFALAWYLRAEAWGWIDPLSGKSAEDVHKAARYAADLNGRTRRILDGEIAFQSGYWRRAERIYNELLLDYPNDIEATGQLAEVYIHYSPFEDEQLRALELFNKVGQLTPGSRQFGMHEADLEAFKGRLTGDYHGLDSLVAIFADTPVPARGETVNWSRALNQMNEATARNIRMYARLTGSHEDSLASLNWGRTGFEELRWLTFGNPHQAEISVNAWQRNDHIVMWATLAAQGRFKEAGSMAFGSAQYEAFALAHTALVTSLDGSDVSLDSLNSMVAKIDAWPASEASLSLMDSGNEKFKAYVKALVAFRMKDAALFEQRVAAFDVARTDSTEHPVWEAMNNELLGLERWLAGDLEGAIRAMSNAFVQGVDLFNSELWWDPLLTRIQPYRFMARLHELNGQPEEALRYYKAVVYHPEHQAIGWENAARMHADLGQTADAIRYYSLMMDNWKNADPVLQPRVEAARQEVERLLDIQAREPQ